MGNSCLNYDFRNRKFSEYNFIGFINESLPKLQENKRDFNKELRELFDDNYLQLINYSIIQIMECVIDFITRFKILESKLSEGKMEEVISFLQERKTPFLVDEEILSEKAAEKEIKEEKAKLSKLLKKTKLSPEEVELFYIEKVKIKYMEMGNGLKSKMYNVRSEIESFLNGRVIGDEECEESFDKIREEILKSINLEIMNKMQVFYDILNKVYSNQQYRYLHVISIKDINQIINSINSCISLEPITP
jgi:hypothetical protein